MKTRKSNQLQRAWYFSCGLIAGLTTLSLSFGSVPSRVTDDTVLYQKLSEIRVAREAQPEFDRDLNRLAAVEGRYAENLPPLGAQTRISGPAKRISQQKYRYTGTRSSSARR
ncbi:MAG: hypothetical protein NDJ90_11830 [Oligoflexia bacterium]|nr:hypothetical protein [Oligoflexia bacterium]